MNLPRILLLATLKQSASAFTPQIHHSPVSTIPPRPRNPPLSIATNLPTTTTPQQEETPIIANDPSTHYNAVIVGGGPAGLLAAIMLAQLPNNHHARIAVYDRLPPPPPPTNPSYSTNLSKYYLLGLGHRGQHALRRFDVLRNVEDASVAVVGRMDWSPGKSQWEDGVVRLSDDKLVETRVLPRDKLVGVLRRAIEERYHDVVELNFGYRLDPISFGDEATPVALAVTPENEDPGGPSPNIITTDFLIGADGAARTIANAMEDGEVQRRRLLHPLRRLLRPGFRVTRFMDDNPRVYKSIPISFPSDWPSNLNYSARSTGNRAALEALPSDGNGNYCALLLLRPEDELAQVECDPAVLREFFDREYPQFSPLIGDEVMEDVAKKGASALPGFRFAGPRLHEGSRTVILGDAVHTVKPYYGLGANTALEDVSTLADILNSTSNISHAVRQFTERRSADSRALVTISRGMDRPGKVGTMRFILPLILDSIFHKLAPRIFGPSMFGMFQMEGIGFREIQLKKRRDRSLQVVFIFLGMSLVSLGLQSAGKMLLKIVL